MRKVVNDYSVESIMEGKEDAPLQWLIGKWEHHWCVESIMEAQNKPPTRPSNPLQSSTYLFHLSPSFTFPPFLFNFVCTF
ncbi:hypothetical protein L1887_10865 [Cichorium endivia]|nr:hypothetical protein L1887_10865 [Cichorium endivia]